MNFPLPRSADAINVELIGQLCEFGSSYDELCTAVFDNGTNAQGRIAGVDRHICGTCTQNPVNRDNQLRRARQEYPDALVTRNTAVAQHFRDVVYSGVELGVREGFAGRSPLSGSPGTPAAKRSAHVLVGRSSIDLRSGGECIELDAFCAGKHVDLGRRPWRGERSADQGQDMTQRLVEIVVRVEDIVRIKQIDLERSIPLVVTNDDVDRVQ